MIKRFCAQHIPNTEIAWDSIQIPKVLELTCSSTEVIEASLIVVWLQSISVLEITLNLLCVLLELYLHSVT